MDIVNDFVPKDIIVKLKLPNQRAYEVAWSIAILRGYENLDELVNDVFLVSIEMFPDERDDFEISVGFQNKRTEGKRTGKDIAIMSSHFLSLTKLFILTINISCLYICYIHVTYMLSTCYTYLTNIEGKPSVTYRK